VPVKDILSLTTGSFEFKLNVDARSHRPAEPIDNSIRGVLPGVIADYTNRQLPGVYTFAYFGNVNDGGYGWAVLPVKFKNQKGELVEPARVLDYPITFPVATRSTQATLQLITELVSKESKQKVEFRKLVSEANMTGRPIETKPVDLPQNQVVKLSAQNEPARSVIARTLRNIERGNPRNHKPIPQRAWRLLYSIETGSYYLDVVDVKQELYRPDGSSAGLRLVPWPTETGAPPAGTK
jgi:hypothetical protein